MIISETQNRVNSRWLQACVLFGTIIVLPFGVAYSQDDGARKRLEAAGTEIRKAVAEGKITAEEGRSKMEAIREMVTEKHKDAAKREHSLDAAKAHLEKTKKSLTAAVEAGKISEEDAKKKYAGAEKAVKERMANRGDIREAGDKMAGAREYLLKLRKELAAAVEAGKISKEDAKKRYQGAENTLKEKMAAGRSETRQEERKQIAARDHLMKVRKELGALVEAGKISEEDAKKKFAAAEKSIRERMAAGQGQRESKRITEEDLARIGIEIRKAVAAGKLSAEDGRKKMEAMRKMMAEQGARRERTERGGDARPDWEGIKRRVEGAVKAGKMTREQADAKYKEIRETFAKERGGER